MLILLGGLFLLRNASLVAAVDRWWALFLLLPAAVTAGTSWTRYQAGGRRLTRRSADPTAAVRAIA